MAYSKKIHPVLCDCGNKATVDVYDNRNDWYGPKCTPCGTRLVKSLNVEESLRPAPTTGEGETNG